MGLFGAILRQLGVLPKTRLVDTLTKEELLKLKIEAEKYMVDEILIWIEKTKFIKTEIVSSIILLGIVEYDSDDLKKIYALINLEHFNSLKLSSADSFNPNGDYIQFFLIKMVDNAQYLLILEHGANLDSGMIFKDFFKVEGLNIELSNYPNSVIYR